MNRKTKIIVSSVAAVVAIVAIAGLAGNKSSSTSAAAQTSAPVTVTAAAPPAVTKTETAAPVTKTVEVTPQACQDAILGLLEVGKAQNDASMLNVAAIELAGRDQFNAAADKVNEATEINKGATTKLTSLSDEISTCTASVL